MSGKYGRLDIPQINREEPVFILCAQDKLTEPTIEMHRLLVASHECQLVERLQKKIESFRQWQGVKEMPD